MNPGNKVSKKEASVKLTMPQIWCLWATLDAALGGMENPSLATRYRQIMKRPKKVMDEKNSYGS